MEKLKDLRLVELERVVTDVDYKGGEFIQKKTMKRGKCKCSALLKFWVSQKLVYLWILCKFHLNNINNEIHSCQNN